MISIDRNLVSSYNITKLFESFHHGKKFFLGRGVILLVAVNLSRIESDWLAFLGYAVYQVAFILLG